MGSGTYIVLEKKIPDLDTMVDGKTLSRAEENLTNTAQRLGVRPLMDFFSCNPDEAADFLKGEGVTDVEIPGEQWFSAEEGLKTVQTLLSVIDASPELMDTKTDLLGFQRILKEAQKHGVKWHLAIDI